MIEAYSSVSSLGCEDIDPANWLPASVQATLGALDTPVAVLNSAGEVLAVNPAWASVCSDDDLHDCLEGENYLDCCRTQKADPGLLRAVSRVLAGKSDRLDRTSRLGSSGEEVRVTLRPLDDGPARHFLVAHDHGAASVREADEDRLLRAQFEERERLASDLHDSVGQTLVALSLGLARLRRLVGPDRELASVMGEMGESLQQAQSEIRTLSFLLQPPWIDEHGGFERAMRDLVIGFGRRAGLAARVEIAGELGLCRRRELALFRVLQEALVNVHRHAHAEAVKVRLSQTKKAAILKVSDDGRGMGAPDGAPPSPGVGILGMRARLGKFGGELRIVSGHAGTTVVARLPI